MFEKNNMRVFTTRLPEHLISLLRQEKQNSSRSLERIVSDIISQHYAAEIEP